ncbi:MAG: GGDEF domain-containing protein [Sulfurospirillum sp.]|jgi:diguanylate cyclase (GGDEF)-like protein|nr:GGDEF domain-containing protein [Sulfurospirillum sp.]MBP9492544.1 GGDEF domain-containing protein [Sulfurospirillum sp.]MBP9612177.1 GGDEF domain-containing protein [Sulfurospirillum sp.]
MHSSIVFLEIILIIMGAIFLVSSLVPIKKVILELSSGELQRKWKVLSILVFFFIFSYIVFCYNLWQIRNVLNPLSFIVALMLLGGGVFVYLVGQLALKTMSDIRKIAILQYESITDSLTGLKNRRYFDQRLHEEIAHSRRYRLPLSLLLIDVDHFKVVNDTYGHQIGDEVLKNLSKVILEMVRDSDIVARYGGEEIAIITPNTEKAEAILLAERLRNIVQKSTLASIDATQEVVQITISIGVSTLNLVVMDKDALVEEADKALYEAKKLGRNRVQISS